MANLADIVVDDTSTSSVGNSERARKALTEDVEGAGTETETASPVVSGNESPLETVLAGDTVPEKFRGKKLTDVLESYSNLESRMGAMANDLGVQRQLTDRLLNLKRDDDLKRNTPPARQKPEVTASELLDRPAETLDRVLTQREQSINEAVDRRLAQLQISQAEANFKRNHGDFQQIVNDPAFGDWLRKSPIRLRAAAAANSGDWTIADELFADYKAERGASASTRQTASSSSRQNLEAARSATLESSTGAQGSDGGKKGKIYSRADLMRLRIEDPEAYYDDDFQAKILKAHQEGRVR